MNTEVHLNVNTDSLKNMEHIPGGVVWYGVEY